jgi:hypothetical protein
MRRRFSRQRRGAVLAEFLIALGPFLLLFLGVLQLGLISLAKLSVRYAASCAARAAIVVRPAQSEGRAQGFVKDPIKDAAVYALIAVAPSVALAPRPSVGDALDGPGGIAKVALKAAEAERATGVIVHDLPGEWNAQITTRVVHLYKCQVPLASRFFCSTGATLPPDARADLERAGVAPPAIGRYLVLRADQTLTKQGRPRRF